MLGAEMTRQSLAPFSFLKIGQKLIAEIVTGFVKGVEFDQGHNCIHLEITV
jgi:hypothetical protein